MPGFLFQNLFDGLAKICTVLIWIFCDVYITPFVVVLDIYSERIEVTMDDIWKLDTFITNQTALGKVANCLTY